MNFDGEKFEKNPEELFILNFRGENDEKIMEKIDINILLNKYDIQGSLRLEVE